MKKLINEVHYFIQNLLYQINFKKSTNNSKQLLFWQNKNKIAKEKLKYLLTILITISLVHDFFIVGILHWSNNSWLQLLSTPIKTIIEYLKILF